MNSPYKIKLNKVVRLNDDLKNEDLAICTFLVKFFAGVDYYNNHASYDYNYSPEVRDVLEQVITLSVIDSFLNDYTYSRYYQFKEYVRYECTPVSKWSDRSLTQKVLGAIEALSYSDDEDVLESLRMLYVAIKSNYSAIDLVRIIGGNYGTETPNS